MDKTIPISELQVRAKKWVDQVKDTDEPLVVTQRGKPAAVLVSCGDYESLLATRDEMSYPDWRERLDRAKREEVGGDWISAEAYHKRRKAP